MLDWFRILGSIILIDLVLSGDNALIIGAAVALLPKRVQFLAIALGGGGAIILRIAFAIGATLMLQVPLLKALGGLALIGIAVKLLLDRTKGEQSRQGSMKSGLLSALWTILIADVTSSLDNVLAVGALANGQLVLLALGLLLSIICLLVASAIIAKLIARLPWLVDVASLVLAWTAAQMLLEDVHVAQVLVYVPVSTILVPAFSIIAVFGVCVWSRLRVAPVVAK